MIATSSKGIFYPPDIALPSDTPGAAYARPAFNNPTLSGLPLGILSNVINSILRPVGWILYSNARFSSLRDLNVETDYAGVSGLEGPLRGFSARWDPTVIPSASLHESVSSATKITESGHYINKNWSGRFIQKYSLPSEDGGLSPVDVAMVLLELVGRKQEAKAGDKPRVGELRTGKRGLHTAWMQVDRDRVLTAARESAKRWDAEKRKKCGEDIGDEEGVRWIHLGEDRKGCLDGVFIGVKDEVRIFIQS